MLLSLANISKRDIAKNGVFWVIATGPDLGGSIDRAANPHPAMEFDGKGPTLV